MVALQSVFLIVENFALMSQLALQSVLYRWKLCIRSAVGILQNNERFLKLKYVNFYTKV